MDQDLEKLHRLAARDGGRGGEHVKTHRTKKEKNEMSRFDKFVTEGNQKADELAIERGMLDEGFMAEARAKTTQQEREEVYAAVQYATSIHFFVEEWENCDGSLPQSQPVTQISKQRKLSHRCLF